MKHVQPDVSTTYLQSEDKFDLDILLDDSGEYLTFQEEFESNLPDLLKQIADLHDCPNVLYTIHYIQ